jgi:hypothetical protein
VYQYLFFHCLQLLHIAFNPTILSLRFFFGGPTSWQKVLLQIVLQLGSGHREWRIVRQQNLRGAVGWGCNKLLIDLSDPKKFSHNHIDDGVLTFNNLSQAEREASHGMRANNDQLKGNFVRLGQVYLAIGYR